MRSSNIKTRDGDRGNTLKFWEEKWGGKTQRSETWTTNRAFYYITNSKAKSVLDLGCGVSKLLIRLKQIGYETLGIDISEKAIEKLRGHGVDGIAMNVYDLDQLDGKYDYIVSNHLLEHLYQDEKFIRLCKDKLNKDGTLFIAVPDNMSSPQEAEDHVQMYNSETLKSLMLKVFNNCRLEKIGNHLIAICENTN